MGIAIKHPVLDRIKPPFVIFDIGGARGTGTVLTIRVPGCQKLQMTA